MTPDRRSVDHPTASKSTPDRAIENRGNRRSKNNSTAALDPMAVSSVNIDPSPGNGEIQNSVADRWLSTQEVSRRLQIPEKTLANWASLGKGPRFARMGRYRRYRFSDLLAWEDAQLDLGESA